MPPPVSGTPLVSDGNNMLGFSDNTIPYLRNQFWYGLLEAQNFNAGAGPTPVVFRLNPQFQANKTNGAVVPNISQPSNTEFLGGFSGQALYRVDFNIYFDPASAGIGNSTVILYFTRGGVTQKTDGALTNGGTNSITGTFIVPLNSVDPLDKVQFMVQRVSGILPLNTFGPLPTGSQFSSTVTFQLINFIR